MTVWLRRIDVSFLHDHSLSWQERRDRVVATLRADPWYAEHGDGSDLDGAIDGMTEATDPDAFDDAWDAVYDLADADMVWLEAWESPKGA